MTIQFELHADHQAVNADSFQLISKRQLTPAEVPAATAEARFIEPVSVIVLAASAAVLAERIVNHWLRSREQGVEIDFRRSPALVSRLAGTPYGFVVLIRPDGSTEALQAKYDNPHELVQLVQSLTKAFGSDP
jgi:hypothetical protein